jgi:hypothetical protein
MSQATWEARAQSAAYKKNKKSFIYSRLLAAQRCGSGGTGTGTGSCPRGRLQVQAPGVTLAMAGSTTSIQGRGLLVPVAQEPLAQLVVLVEPAWHESRDGREQKRRKIQGFRHPGLQPPPQAEEQLPASLVVLTSGSIPKVSCSL